MLGPVKDQHGDIKMNFYLKHGVQTVKCLCTHDRDLFNIYKAKASRTQQKRGSLGNMQPTGRISPRVPTGSGSASLKRRKIGGPSASGLVAQQAGTNMTNIGRNFFETTLKGIHEHWPLGAIAEFIHNANDAEATQITIGIPNHIRVKLDENADDLVAIPVEDRHLLELDDNGKGMSHKMMEKLFVIGQNHGRGDGVNSKIGGYGIGFKSGFVALGHTVVVMSFCKKDMTVSLGLLTIKPTFGTGTAGHVMMYGTYKAGDADKIVGGHDQPAMVAAIKKYVPQLKVEQRYYKFVHGHEFKETSGTRVYICGLNTQEVHDADVHDAMDSLDALALKFDFENEDIRVRGQRAGNGRRAKGAAPLSDMSLRALVEIMFTTPETGWAGRGKTGIIVQLMGRAVNTIELKDQLAPGEFQDYQIDVSKLAEGKGEPRPERHLAVDIRVGVHPASKERFQYGACLYSNGHLVQAFEKDRCVEGAYENDGNGVLMVANLPAQCADHASRSADGQEYCSDVLSGRFCHHEYVADRGKTYFETDKGAYSMLTDVLKQLFERFRVVIEQKDVKKNPVKYIAELVDREARQHQPDDWSVRDRDAGADLEMFKKAPGKGYNAKHTMSTLLAHAKTSAYGKDLEAFTRDFEEMCKFEQLWQVNNNPESHGNDQYWLKTPDTMTEVEKKAWSGKSRDKYQDKDRGMFSIPNMMKFCKNEHDETERRKHPIPAAFAESIVQNTNLKRTKSNKIGINDDLNYGTSIWMPADEAVLSYLFVDSMRSDFRDKMAKAAATLQSNLVKKKKSFSLAADSEIQFAFCDDCGKMREVTLARMNRIKAKNDKWHCYDEDSPVANCAVPADGEHKEDQKDDISTIMSQKVPDLPKHVYFKGELPVRPKPAPPREMATASNPRVRKAEDAPGGSGGGEAALAIAPASPPHGGGPHSLAVVSAITSPPRDPRKRARVVQPALPATQQSRDPRQRPNRDPRQRAGPRVDPRPRPNLPGAGTGCSPVLPAATSQHMTTAPVAQRAVYTSPPSPSSPGRAANGQPTNWDPKFGAGWSFTWQNAENKFYYWADVDKVPSWGSPMPEPAVKHKLNTLPDTIFQQLSALNGEKKVRWTDYTVEGLGFCISSLPRAEDLQKCFATFSQSDIPWVTVKNKSTLLKKMAIQVADERIHEETLTREKAQRDERARRDAAEEEKERERQRKRQEQADKEAKRLAEQADKEAKRLAEEAMRKAEHEQRQRDHDAEIEAGRLLYVPRRGPCKGKLGELDEAEIREEGGQYFLVFVLKRKGKSYVARKFSIPPLRIGSPADDVAGTHFALGSVGKWLPSKKFEVRSTSVPKLKEVWFRVKKADEAEMRRKATQQQEASKRPKDAQATADIVEVKMPDDRQASDGADQLKQQYAELAREKRESDAKAKEETQKAQAKEDELRQAAERREAAEQEAAELKREMAVMQQQMQQMQRAASSSNPGEASGSSSVEPVATPNSRADVAPAAVDAAEPENESDSDDSSDDGWTKEEEHPSDDEQQHSSELAGGGELELDESQDIGVSVRASRQISLEDED